MGCCNRITTNSKGSSFFVDILIDKQSIPVVASFLWSVNEIPVMLDRLYEPMTLVFIDYNASRISTGKYKGRAEFRSATQQEVSSLSRMNWGNLLTEFSREQP